MPTSDWLIGSFNDLPQQSLTVTTTGPVAEARIIAAGDYYLYDDSSSHDLLEALRSALEGHSVLSGVSVLLMQNRRVRLTGVQAFAVTWPSDGLLRDLLGFTGNLTSNTSHSATNVSPLFWSAGRTATTEARFGTDGIPVHDTAWGQSGPGTLYATSHNEYRRNSLIWRYVLNARVWTTSEAGGEYFAFWRDVLRLGRRFKVWRGIVESDASTTTVDVSGEAVGLLPSTGAYRFAPPERPVSMQYAREFGYVESMHPITIPCVTAIEYT